MNEPITTPSIFFIYEHGACGERIILRSHETSKIYTTLMEGHDCAECKLSYIMQVSRGFKIEKQLQAKGEPADFFIVQHGMCGEKIILRSHETSEIPTTFIEVHDCTKDGFPYVMQVSRGFKLMKRPKANDAPVESGSFDPETSKPPDPRDYG